MPKIGPTFGDELRAAGLNELVSWNPETGELYMTGLDETQQEAVREVLANHDPTKKTPDQQMAEAIAAGYHDDALGVTLAIDPQSQIEITAQGSAASGVLRAQAPDADTEEFLFPSQSGKPVIVTGAQNAFDLANRCRIYVQNMRRAQFGI
jgi:hypothetical protein